MAKVETVRVVQTDLHEHPAVRAWRELQAVHIEPERIEILKGKLPKQSKRSKRYVCRLVGAGPVGSDVIGKRCRRGSAVIENTIYEDILPYLPVPSPDYYGMLEETNGEFCWLFLEDAGEQEYSTLNGEHRELVTQWLGLMHTFATHIATPACLPDKGPNHYLKRVQFARSKILEILASLTLQADYVAHLETILRQFDLLKSHWDEVEEFCDGIPRTLVHGDFVAKNLRVRISQSGRTLMPFDWGEAGWGPPATDIRHVDASDYWLMVRGHWPWLNVQAIQRLAIAGKIFRCLDAIYWELPNFRFQWLKETINNMRIYKERLGAAIQATRWED